MIDQQIEIPTKTATPRPSSAIPERGRSHPSSCLYMDAPAIARNCADMARRLATSGYYVMLPNL